MVCTKKLEQQSNQPDLKQRFPQKQILSDYSKITNLKCPTLGIRPQPHFSKPKIKASRFRRISINFFEMEISAGPTILWEAMVIAQIVEERCPLNMGGKYHWLILESWPNVVHDFILFLSLFGFYNVIP